MSYSFNTSGADKAEAKTNVRAELDKVVESQPIHESDSFIAEETAGTLIDILRDPRENEAILVNVNGSCYSQGGDKLDGVSLNVAVSFRPK